jgi:hypothetical protein
MASFHRPYSYPVKQVLEIIVVNKKCFRGNSIDFEKFIGGIDRFISWGDGADFFTHLCMAHCVNSLLFFLSFLDLYVSSEVVKGVEVREATGG